MTLTVLAPPMAALARSLVAHGGLTDLFETFETAGQVLFGLGLVPWLLKHLRGRSAAAKVFKQATVALAKAGTLGAVPLIIDVRQTAAWSGSVPVEFEPLLGMLARWKPRAEERESGYEQSLVRADDLSQVKKAFDLNGYVGILYLLTLAAALYGPWKH